MAFEWMTHPARPRRSGDRDRRVAMYRDELAERAKLLCRLGYPPSRAIARLRANLEWDFEVGALPAPRRLSEKHIGELVKSAYLRRAAR